MARQRRHGGANSKSSNGSNNATSANKHNGTNSSNSTSTTTYSNSNGNTNATPATAANSSHQPAAHKVKANAKHGGNGHHESQSTHSGSSSASSSSKNHSSGHSSGHSSIHSSGSSSKSATTGSHKKSTPLDISLKTMLGGWKVLLGSICLLVASTFGYLGYLETRVNTPFDNQRMVQRSGLDDPDRYWGSYRPGNYFGMKTRDPHSLVMGLMWYAPSDLGHGGKGIRHWCDLGDHLEHYGWSHHDGRTFGVQEIHDSALELKTSFIKYPGNKQFGGDWTARIAVRNTSSLRDRTVSLIWYVALDDRTNGLIKYVSDEQSPEPGVYGETQGLGQFQVRFHPNKGRILHKSYLSTVATSLSYLKESVFSHFRIFANKMGRRFVGLPGAMISQNAGAVPSPNFIAIQFTVEMDFSMDITYHSTTGFEVGETIPLPPKGRLYSAALEVKMLEFDERFERTFQLEAKGFSAQEIRFAKYALSNMIGGIGYFYGSSRVQSVHTKNPVPYWKSPLYTAVPSRSFFPRGFLWDEGFHGLLISSWDLDIELDIICHWFDLLNVEGWIPREQILGVEAKAKVPEEFVTQQNTNANPPTFFLTLKKILTHHKKELSLNNRLATLDRLYPRLQAWFHWYNVTQKGDELGTYRWRGRDTESERELNPKTLTSGLDDFPRASHPTNKERHVDLRCWIAFAASVMFDLGTLLGKDSIKYYETASFLMDNQLLNEQHLSPFTETYADWGLHTDSVVLKRPQLTQRSANKVQPQKQEMVRVTLKQPDYKFVDSTYGYVNLFPFLLEILEHDSPHLGRMLRDIREKLWTKFGLRSLAKTSPLYMERNTEHDPPYWRGPIWININYLALRALKNYGTKEGPYAASARTLYTELRENIIANIFKEFKRTGYIWEQYDDATGEGKGCNPFTGWSSLVVLIMAEQY